MELGLSLGDASKAPPPFGFMDEPPNDDRAVTTTTSSTSLGFCMALSIAPTTPATATTITKSREIAASSLAVVDDHHTSTSNSSIDPPLLQLDLLPNTPVPRKHLFPWSSSHHVNGGISSSSTCEVGSSSGNNNIITVGSSSCRGGLVDVNRLPVVEEMGNDNIDHDGGEEYGGGTATLSSSPPNSTSASSFQMDFSIYSKAHGNSTANGNSSRAGSDEEENGSTRKKLRLSKEQSAFLEESFKEHSTLNPKQKLALAKQLNLRPRQVEVWFQNRRARTKLKQTEVDCEYLKRCCETLTEENRRLQKELQELRALKTTSNPFYMQLPATTLTMCPSCERVATTTSSAAPAAITTPTTTNNNSKNNNSNSDDPTSKTSSSSGLSLSSRGRFYPFSHSQPHHHTQVQHPTPS